MHLFLIVLGILAAGLGLLTMTNATMGPCLIGIACLLGIFARMDQAAKHQGELLKALGKPQA